MARRYREQSIWNKKVLSKYQHYQRVCRKIKFPQVHYNPYFAYTTKIAIMRKSFRCLVALSCILVSVCATAQTTISGNVRNSLTKEPVPAVSVTLKGSGTGTFTDDKGNFKFTTAQKPPLTLVITSIAFAPQEVTVSNANDFVQVDFIPGSDLGAEVVISASRVPERILESPVSIERMNTQAIRVAAAPNYYDGIANLKGVDLTTSSLTFRTLSTRGFNGSGNLRFNQLVDGIDNQAPGLNFSVGNIVGMTELDVDNVELLQGASSALYGSGGMNGTLLMTSKSPFKYQGLSFQIKQGIMHFEDPNTDPSGYYDWSVRWAKKIGERFAFKVSGQFMKANDWQATDYRNLQRNNVFSSLKNGDRDTDPNYDGVNVFGDEASANMRSFAQVFQGQTRAGILAATGNTLDIVTSMNTNLPANATPAQIATYIGSLPAALQPTVQSLVPFYFGLRNNVISSQDVSRKGYNENELVDYKSYNVKLSGGLYYKITDGIEASLLGYWGTGTTVYTGADRYSVKNLKMGQYKLEVKAKNWFVRAYTVQENSGDAYTATTAALAVNNAWKPNSTWFAQYVGNYSGARLQGATDAQAHAAARTAAETGRYLPGSTEFKAAFEKAINTPINSQGTGAKFADKTDMYHLEGQLNLTEYVKFAEVLIGANFRRFNLNSNGTIFADTAGTIKIDEYGGYLQVQKWVLPDLLKLTVSGRYDKNENFDGRFTPRATALVKVAKDNSIRVSYQQAYRFPSTQDQWINLRTPGSILIGGLPDFFDYYKFGSNPPYTAQSIVAYRASVNNGTPNPGLLVVAGFPELKPEISNSYEIGYRGLVTRSLLVDAYVYYSEYKDFIGRTAVGRGQSGNPALAAQELANPFTTTNYSFVSNSKSTVKAIGWGVSTNYRIGKGYEIGVNVSGDQLRDVEPGLVTFFNTPKWRYNITFSNDRIGGKNWGFNILYRWQDKVLWEGTFGTGEVPSFGNLDAMISYRLPKIKSLLKLGATNLLNDYYNSAFGNPSIGGLYYVSFGYNVF
jgi:outer membrane receptor protein involved in Fe transport